MNPQQLDSIPQEIYTQIPLDLDALEEAIAACTAGPWDAAKETFASEEEMIAACGLPLHANIEREKEVHDEQRAEATGDEKGA